MSELKLVDVAEIEKLKQRLVVGLAVQDCIVLSELRALPDHSPTVSEPSPPTDTVKKDGFEFPKLGGGIYKHPSLGELYDRLQVHQYAVGNCEVLYKELHKDADKVSISKAEYDALVADADDFPKEKYQVAVSLVELCTRLLADKKLNSAITEEMQSLVDAFKY